MTSSPPAALTTLTSSSFEDQRRHTHVVDTARRIAARYGFDEWTTPIFEDTRVFSRTLGETLRRGHQGDVYFHRSWR